MAEELYEIQLTNGEAVLIRPLSTFVRLDIQEAAEEQYPDPDPALFAPDDVPNAASDEIAAVMKVQLARQSDGYARAMSEVENLRWVYIYNQAVRAGMVAGTPEGKAETIKRLAARRAEAVSVIRKPPDDEWLQTVLYVLVTSWGDLQNAYRVASRQLTEEALQKAAKRFQGTL